MRPFLFAALLVASTAPALAAAQSPFDGTWKADIKSLHIASRPDHYLLKSGTFSCSTCTPTPYAIRADGAFHAVKDRPYWNEQSIAIVDPRTVKREFRSNGKVIAGSTETVSADGMTLTTDYWNINNGAALRETGSGAQKRVGAPIAGAHAISGQWQASPPTQMSDTAMLMTIRIAGGTMVMKSPRNETLTARIGGGYAPNVGDPGKTMTKVAMTGPRTLAFTDMRDGRIVQTSTYTVSADGTTLTGRWKETIGGATGGFTARKQ